MRPLVLAGGPRRRVAVIAPARAPIAQPFLGGLESHVSSLVTAMRSRGHDITLFAAPGSDPELRPVDLQLDLSWLSADARRDVSMQPDSVMAEHHAYLRLMTTLATSDCFDVVHNHSLHYLPVAMAPMIPVPVVTTLHTPPTPWLESAIHTAGDVPDEPGAGYFVAVSEHTASRWRRLIPRVAVVPNGIDVTAWPTGPGGSDAVWCGRIAPEKGLHLALDAARHAGVPLVVAGPIVDGEYFEQEIRPRLGRHASHVGHLDSAQLAALVGRSAVAVVTPDWDEPYGLVVAEALACGTPVAAFRRGGIPEIVDAGCARLAEPGDVRALSSAIRDAMTLKRSRARARALRHCSIDTMITRYESVLSGVLLAHSA